MPKSKRDALKELTPQEYVFWMVLKIFDFHISQLDAKFIFSLVEDIQKKGKDITLGNIYELYLGDELKKQ